MGTINKFGSKDKSQESGDEITNIVRNLLNQSKSGYITLSETDPAEFDANEKRISNLGNPVLEGDAVNKRFVDNYMSVPRTYDLDMNNRRITNLTYPLADNDAVPLIYLKRAFLVNWSLLLINLSPKMVNGYHVIEPFGLNAYELPFECTIKFNQCNFDPRQIEVHLDQTVLDTFFDKNFHDVKLGSKLQFAGKPTNTNQMFIEMLIRPQTTYK